MLHMALAMLSHKWRPKTTTANRSLILSREHDRSHVYKRVSCHIHFSHNVIFRRKTVFREHLV